MTNTMTIIIITSNTSSWDDCGDVAVDILNCMINCYAVCLIQVLQWMMLLQLVIVAFVSKLYCSESGQFIDFWVNFLQCGTCHLNLFCDTDHRWLSAIQIIIK